MKRRPLELRWRALLEHVRDDLDRFVELGVAAGYSVSGRNLHLDIRGNTVVLNHPAVLRPDGQVRCGQHAPIHEDRKSQRSDETSAAGGTQDRKIFVAGELVDFLRFRVGGQPAGFFPLTSAVQRSPA